MKRKRGRTRVKTAFSTPFAGWSWPKTGAEEEAAVLSAISSWRAAVPDELAPSVFKSTWFYGVNSVSRAMELGKPIAALLVQRSGPEHAVEALLACASACGCPCLAITCSRARALATALQMRTAHAVALRADLDGELAGAMQARELLLVLRRLARVPESPLLTASKVKLLPVSTVSISLESSERGEKRRCARAVRKAKGKERRRKKRSTLLLSGSSVRIEEEEKSGD